MAHITNQFLPIVDWDNFHPTNENYHRIKEAALEFARIAFDPKKLKHEALVWAEKRLDTDEISILNAAEDWRFMAIGKYLYAINQGGEFDDNCLRWLDIKIEEVLVFGRKNILEQEKINALKPVLPKIDPILRDIRLGRQLAMEMEELILTGVYPKDQESAYNVLSNNQASPTILRNAISRLQEFVDESNSFNEDEIIEGFGSKKKWRSSKNSYAGLLIIAQNFTTNSKTQRKAAKKRKKTGARAVKVTEAVNFKKMHDELQLVSIDPSSIISAKALLVYNTKTRKIGLYFAENEDGLQVRGTTIHNYSEDSYQKTLRKPDKQIDIFRSAMLKRCCIVLGDYIKSKKTKMNGRLNEHIVLMKSWK